MKHVLFTIGAVTISHVTLAADLPTSTGQAGFEAIAEIVDMLESDPNTDWSNVNISALREHLVDMNAVTMDSQVKTHDANGMIMYHVTSENARTITAIQNMVTAHMHMAEADTGWAMGVETVDDGAILSITPANEAEGQKIRALGFFGWLAMGAHHQEHHMMIATGANPHGSDEMSEHSHDMSEHSH